MVTLLACCVPDLKLDCRIIEIHCLSQERSWREGGREGGRERGREGDPCFSETIWKDYKWNATKGARGYMYINTGANV